MGLSSLPHYTSHPSMHRVLTSPDSEDGASLRRVGEERVWTCDYVGTFSITNCSSDTYYTPGFLIDRRNLFCGLEWHAGRKECILEHGVTICSADHLLLYESDNKPSLVGLLAACESRARPNCRRRVV